MSLYVMAQEKFISDGQGASACDNAEAIDDVVVSVGDDIATIQLNRPDRLNAMSWTCIDRLSAAIRTAGQDPRVRCIIVTGAGRAFSSGLDLNTLPTTNGEQHPADQVSDRMQESIAPLCRSLLDSPVPVVAAINGICAGGAVGLALLADIAIASRTAYFYVPHVVALGIVPDLGMTWTLPRTIGRARSLGMALLGDRISAQQAQHWGLIWACVDDPDLQSEASTTAARLARLNPGAAKRTRTLFDQAPSTDLNDQLDAERTEVRTLMEQLYRELAERPATQ